MRSSSSLLVVLMLLLGPALCMSGLLKHECDCGDGEMEMQCEHESSCSDDPCESLSVPVERRVQTRLVIEGLWVPGPLVLRAGTVVSTPGPSPSGPRLPERWNLPYRQSDRPLRI